MRFQNRVVLFFLCAIITFFNSCIKEQIVTPNILIPNSAQRVAILCEGNYMWGNARLDIYSIDSNKFFINVFESENKKPLGDVLQSGYFDGRKLWLAVNNSGKIVKINPSSYKQENARGSLHSPRYLLPLGKYLFCTDILANAVSVLDTSNLQTVKEIQVFPNQKSSRFGWTEHVIAWNNKATVACYDGKVLQINPLTFDTNEFFSDSGTQNLVVDAHNRLWVLASVNGKSSLTCFNENLKLEKRIAFDPGQDIKRLVISPEKDQLYFIGQNKVYSISIEANSIGDKKLVFNPVTISQSINCYGIGIDPRNGWLYVADAKDYVSNGTIFIINRDGKMVNSFQTGVIPSDFVFF